MTTRDARPLHASVPVSCAVGLLAGLVAGSLGVGGGIVMTPLLASWAGAPIKRAVGTSLLGVLVLATAAVTGELVVEPTNLHWGAAGLLAIGAVIGAWVGTRVIVATPPLLLRRLLAALLLLAALKMSGLAGALLGDAPSAPAWLSAMSVPAHVVTGVLAGIVSSMFGVGGGILAVPLLALLHPTWVFQECRATSLIMIVPTALAGALLHRRLQHVDERLAAGLLPAGVVGCAGGVLLANSVPERPLELVFAALLVLAAVRLLRRPPQAAPA